MQLNSKCEKLDGFRGFYERYLYPCAKHARDWIFTSTDVFVAAGAHLLKVKTNGVSYDLMLQLFAAQSFPFVRASKF